MITFTVDNTNYNRAIHGFATKLHIQSGFVILKEAGELMKTLVQLTPPSKWTNDGSRQKQSKAIAKDVNLRFDAARTSANSHLKSANLSRGVEWYAWNPDELYGVAAGKNYSGADDETIRQLNYRVMPSGRQRLPFLHPRKHQVVILRQNILVTKQQRARLVKRLQGHIGRLKAAWLVAWNGAGRGGQVILAGSNMPPQFVTKHAIGALGRFENNIKDSKVPSFTIANSAAGTAQPVLKWVVKRAIEIRTGAITKNLSLYLRGKKRISQYA